MTLRSTRWTRRILILAVLSTAWMAAPHVPGQGSRETGTLQLAPRTDRGNWDGTWYYVSRDFRMMIWMRTTNDRPELKLQYQSLAAAEGFVTDWTGEATYNLKRAPATFAMKIEQGDLDTASGTWDWELDFGDSSRVERARFSLYRSGDGRGMVMLFDELARIVNRGGGERRREFARAWTFRKVSRRHVRWEEIFP